MPIMPNNLDTIIVRSGMSKREVAALKGITPETLSRQIHGKIQLTLQDAERYARILDCTAQDILFATPPVPIIGYCNLVECDSDDPTCPPMGCYVERKISAGKTMGKVYLPNYIQQNTGAILWSTEKNYTGPFQLWKTAVEFIQLDPIKNEYVSDDAIQHECYALLKNSVTETGSNRSTNLVRGTLYPEPGDLYTIHNATCGAMVKGQEVIWASAILAASFRPNLRGLEIILDK